MRTTKTWKTLIAPLALVAIWGMAAGCGGDDGAATDDGATQDGAAATADGEGADAAAASEDSGAAAADSSAEDDAAVDGSGSDGGGAVDAGIATIGDAVDLKLGLHNNNVTVQLDTMTVLGKEAKTWDFYMAHDDGPNVYLGAGVVGQSLGHAKAFHEIDVAPDASFISDDVTSSPKKLVIGTSWRDGGVGSSGYHMTKDIYILKLKDGTYAKLEVLSAKNGEVHILAYRQADGTKNLKTAP